MVAEKFTKSDGYQEKLVEVRRVSKVVKGGRDFGFAALVVIGDGKGKVGFGRGKSREVPIAIQKAMDQARKNMFYISLAGTTIHYKIASSWGASTVIMKPATEGTGIIAGGAVRAVLEVLGIQNISAKSIGSTNPGNIVRATIEGLKSIRTPDYVANKRGKTIQEVLADHE